MGSPAKNTHFGDLALFCLHALVRWLISLSF
jgi:hypothetical protein